MPYHLIDVERALSTDEHGARVLNYISSYGCPYKCAFCAEQAVFDGKWTGLSAYRMADDFERLVKDYGVECISICDDQFVIDKNRVKGFCEELLERKLNVKWNRVNGNIRQLLKWEDEMWELLVRSGCLNMQIGAESGFPEALRLMNKALSVEETIRLAEKSQKYGIEFLFSMMVGLPWDPDYAKTRKLIDEEIRHTIDLSEKLISISNKYKLIFCIYTPYPGTPLYQRALELGFKPPRNLEDWSNWTYLTRTTPWVLPRQASRTQMLTVSSFFLDTDAYGWTTARVRNRFARLLVKGVYKIVIRIAKLRWRFKFFALPIDYWIYRLAKRILGTSGV